MRCVSQEMDSLEMDMTKSYGEKRELCRWWGAMEQHKQTECPAQKYKAKCRKCEKMGHYARMYWRKQDKNRTVDEVVDETPDIEEINTSSQFFLDAIEEKVCGTAWYITMLANGIPVKVKVDTGANITVFSKAYLKTLKVKTIENVGPA
uniref:Putative LOC102082647 [Oreochromis niloticus] n=1 Tax=Lepeophtheirus salmonis TaxID=72036 RepID=A0A0K2TZF7_LEPSM